MAAQPFKVVRVANKTIVFEITENRLFLTETLVDASHGALAKILKVIFGPHLVIRRVLKKHPVILSTLRSKVKNEVSLKDQVRQISNQKTDHRCVEK